MVYFPPPKKIKNYWVEQKYQLTSHEILYGDGSNGLRNAKLEKMVTLDQVVMTAETFTMTGVDETLVARRKTENGQNMIHGLLVNVHFFLFSHTVF